MHPFERKADKPPNTEINNVIMEYFVTEGYPSTAQLFAAEANIQPKADLESIHERVEIRDSIHKGDLQTAIEKINELNPQLLDTDDSLHFSLLRLQLVELIRGCMSISSGTTNSPDISAALEFATTHLAPLAPANPAFLADLERTMALLIFPSNNLAPQLAELIDPQLRKSVADRVNEAILNSQGARREAQIRKLVRMRAWAEEMARRTKKIQIPEGGLEFGLDEDFATGPRARAELYGDVGPSTALGPHGDTVMQDGNADGDSTLQ